MHKKVIGYIVTSSKRDFDSHLHNICYIVSQGDQFIVLIYLVALSNKEQALSNSKLRTMKLVTLGYYIADIMKMGAEISFARHNYIFHYSPMHRCIKRYLELFVSMEH